jgi:hypothetical protein
MMVALEGDSESLKRIHVNEPVILEEHGGGIREIQESDLLARA